MPITVSPYGALVIGSLNLGCLGRLVSLEQTETHFGIVSIDTNDEIQLTRSLLFFGCISKKEFLIAS